MKKVISILVPTYNEEENVEPLSEAIIEEMGKNLPQYDYELVFIDNDSNDRTREKIRGLCAGKPKIRAISMRRILDSLIPRIMGFCRPMVNVRY